MKRLNSLESHNYTNVNISKICLFLILALALTIVPLPGLMAKCRPNFVLLIVLYMQCCIPVYFRITWIFMLGILLDVLTASMIGQHPLAFVITSWLATTKPSNFRYYSILQQMMVILLYCALYQLLISLVDLFFGINVNFYESLFIVLLTVSFWPILGIIFIMRILPQSPGKYSDFMRFEKKFNKKG